MCARYARVWLEDEIGEVVGAKVSAILLGERPGLGIDLDEQRLAATASASATFS